jgi:hypothetical protein
MPVNMMTVVYWVVMQCSLVDSYLYLQRTYCLHLKDWNELTLRRIFSLVATASCVSFFLSFFLSVGHIFPFSPCYQSASLSPSFLTGTSEPPQQLICFRAWTTHTVQFGCLTVDPFLLTVTHHDLWSQFSHCFSLISHLNTFQYRCKAHWVFTEWVLSFFCGRHCSSLSLTRARAHTHTHTHTHTHYLLINANKLSYADFHLMTGVWDVVFLCPAKKWAISVLSVTSVLLVAVFWDRQVGVNNFLLKHATSWLDPVMILSWVVLSHRLIISLIYGTGRRIVCSYMTPF